MIQYWVDMCSIFTFFQKKSSESAKQEKAGKTDGMKDDCFVGLMTLVELKEKIKGYKSDKPLSENRFRPQLINNQVNIV